MRGLRATSWQGSKKSAVEGSAVLRLHKNLAARSATSGDEAWFTASEAASSHGANMCPAPAGTIMLNLPSPSASAMASHAEPLGPQRRPMCAALFSCVVPWCCLRTGRICVHACGCGHACACVFAWALFVKPC